nr:uncharacterized protein LOC100214715 isoform X2 [Hydra vulgaris]
MESFSDFGKQHLKVKEVFLKEFSKLILESGVIKQELGKSTLNKCFGEKYDNHNLTQFFVKWIIKEIEGSEQKRKSVQEINKIWYLPQVERLEMVECSLGKNIYEKLSFVPYDIGYMKHLKVLNLRHNDLKRLPFALTMCEKLEELLIEYNSFTCLPEFILQFPCINKLYRFHNRFDFSNFNFIEEIPYNKLVFNCETLYLMSLKSILRQVNNYDLKDFLQSFPVHLHHDALKLINGICSNCHKFILHEESYFMYIYKYQTFVNCSYVPVAVYTCSRVCAEVSLNQKKVYDRDDETAETISFSCFDSETKSNSSCFNSKLRSIKRFICL